MSSLYIIPHNPDTVQSSSVTGLLLANVTTILLSTCCGVRTCPAQEVLGEIQDGVQLSPQVICYMETLFSLHLYAAPLTGLLHGPQF